METQSVARKKPMFFAEKWPSTGSGREMLCGVVFSDFAWFTSPHQGPPPYDYESDTDIEVRYGNCTGTESEENIHGRMKPQSPCPLPQVR